MNTETIRARRAKLRSSQYTVAKLAGISRNRLSLIECGYAEMTIDEIKKIQTALDKIEGELKKSSLVMVRKVWRAKK